MIAVGVRVLDTVGGGWATIREVKGERFRVKWDVGQIGMEWWDESEWLFDAPNDPRAPTSPIRTETVTTRRIEPGVYGRLWVAGDAEGWASVAIVPMGVRDWSAPEEVQRSINAPELRELARVATELAEYLDDR